MLENRRNIKKRYTIFEWVLLDLRIFDFQVLPVIALVFQTVTDDIVLQYDKQNTNKVKREEMV